MGLTERDKMDNFIKETTGYVRQSFEPNGEGVFVCTGQEFIVSEGSVDGFNADDLCDFVDDCGNTIEPPKYKYQPYDMMQPKSKK